MEEQNKGDKLKSEDLLIEAKNFFEFYKKELGKSIRKENNVVNLDFMQLTEFSNKLSDEILVNPEDTLRIIEQAIEQSSLADNVRVRLVNLPKTQEIKIRNLRSRHLNEMIMVEGIIRQSSDVRPQVVNAKFECPSCGTVISVLQIEKKFREPSRCSCGRRGGFKLISKEMVDTQRLVVEESPEALSGGEQPKRINVFVKEDLVEPRMEEKTTPGSRIRVIGVLKEVPVPLSSGGLSTRFELAIEVNNLIPLEETFEELDISEEEERQILELSEDPKVFEKLARSITPSVWGYEEIKKALVLQLFGGVRKVHADGQKSRGDIHILLIGDPGVAKSIGRKEKVLYYNKEGFGYESIENLFEKLGKFPENTKTLTINMKTHKPEWAKIDEIIKHTHEKELIKITTEHGKKIIATKDHSFITLSKNGKIIPIKGDKLDKNSYIPIPISFHKQILKEIKTEKFNTHKTNSKQIPEKIKLDEEFGFFIGIFLSEGHIKAGKSINISNKNKKIKEKVFKFAKKINFSSRTNQKEIVINSKSLSNLLKHYCHEKKEITSKVKGNYSRIKQIPDFAYFAPKKFIKGLISGIFSGDGRFLKDKKRIKGFELITISKKLAQGVSDLLFSIGILNKVKESTYNYKSQRTNYYAVAVNSQMIKKFRKNFNFYGREYLPYPKPIYSYNNCIPCGDLVYYITKKLGYNSRINGDRTFAAEMRTVKKRGEIGRIRLRKIIKLFEKRTKEKIKELEILKKIAYSPIIWSKIKNIEKINDKNQHVYDLSIPNKNTFVANGIGVHNSVTLGFIANISPKGRYVVGKSASGAGLTATVIRDEYLRGWSLEAGAMVLSNKGLVCIDELEKMDPQDRSAMHEAMEQQCMLPDFKLMFSNGKYAKIGTFVDELIRKNKKKVYQGKDCEILPVKNVELLSTNWNNIFPQKANRVSRHIAPKEFVQVELTNGRKITVTPEHPCWVVKQGKITVIPAETLTNKMFFPIPSEIKIKSKKYQLKNDYLCKILGYHLSDGCYELNRKKKTGIQFWNNNELLIKDYKNSMETFYKIKPIITKRNNQFAVRVISKKIVDEFQKLDKNLLEKGKIKIIPESIMRLPNKNIKYLLKALYDGDGSVILQKRGGCRISFVSQNRILEEQISDLLLRFKIQSSIFEDKHSKVWRLDITGQENLSNFLTNIGFLSSNKLSRLKQYYEKNKTYKTIKDLVPDCTDKINDIFKRLKISQRKTIGHSIDLGVEKQRIFLQKLVYIAEDKLNEILSASPERSSEYIALNDDLINLRKLAFGYARWMKIKSVSKIKNKGIKWVYDVTIEPDKTFISNGMILHNTVTISKANVQATLRAETSVLAAANPKFGRFDPYQSIAQQIDIPPTLINRFDVIFTLRDIPDRSKDEKIATHVLHEHQRQGEDMLIPRDLFRKYIAYSKQKIKPNLTEEAIEEIKKFYVDLRNKPISSESAMRPIPISARQLQALVRMSEASAKIRLSKKVTTEDAQIAINLMKYYLMQVGYDYESKTFDIDKISSKFSSSQRNKILTVRDTIIGLEDRLGKMIPIEEIEKELEGKMNKEEIEDAINKLLINTEIFKPRRGYVQRM